MISPTHYNVITHQYWDLSQSMLIKSPVTDGFPPQSASNGESVMPLPCLHA